MRIRISLIFAVLALASTSAFATDQSDRNHHQPPECNKYFRLRCRYHNTERNCGVNFCYATAVYRYDGKRIGDVHLGVGCDRDTFFDDKGRLQSETTLDRISPLEWATPGVEVFPQGQLTSPGTYTSVLDISAGRFSGLCYVEEIKASDP